MSESHVGDVQPLDLADIKALLKALCFSEIDFAPSHSALFAEHVVRAVEGVSE